MNAAAPFRSLSAPLASLGIVLGLATFHQVTMVLLHGEVSEVAFRLFNFAYSFAVAWGVEMDRKRNGMPAPFEYPAFMFFLWVVMLPVYLYRTRRWKGLAIAAAVLAATYLPYGMSYLTWLAIA